MVWKSEQGQKMRQLRSSFSAGASVQLYPLFGRDLNSSMEGTPVGKHILENVSDMQIILDL